MSNVILEGTSVADLIKQMTVCVDKATSPLKREIQYLREELRKSGRKAVSHRAAPIYFDDAITHQRVLDYIHGRNLPQGAPGPLPAVKTGQQWYIKVADIEAWQLQQSQVD